MDYKKIVTFDVAKLLKKEGFDRPTQEFYSRSINGKTFVTDAQDYNSDRYVITNWNDGMGSYPTKSDDVECSAPEIWLVVDWFNTTKGIFISVNYDKKLKLFYSEIYIFNNEKTISLQYNKDYTSKNMYAVYNNTFKYLLKDRYEIDHNNVN